MYSDLYGAEVYHGKGGLSGAKKPACAGLKKTLNCSEIQAQLLLYFKYSRQLAATTKNTYLTGASGAITP